MESKDFIGRSNNLDEYMKMRDVTPSAVISDSGSNFNGYAEQSNNDLDSSMNSDTQIINLNNSQSDLNSSFNSTNTNTNIKRLGSNLRNSNTFTTVKKIGGESESDEEEDAISFLKS